MGQNKDQEITYQLLSWAKEIRLEDFNLIYCPLAEIFNYWFGYQETKTRKTFQSPFTLSQAQLHTQAQLHSRHISPHLSVTKGCTQSLQ